MHDQIIVAVFPSRRILIKALDHLLEEVAIDVQEAAVVAKSKTGRILVFSDGPGAEEGSLIGGVTGSVIGLFAGVFVVGFGWGAMLLGALLGGLIGSLVGQVIAGRFRLGFARPYANLVADKLQDGKTALMLRVEDAAVLLPHLQSELKPYRAELVERLREIQTNITNS